MLANNLRDLETDIENHRYTLVYYIGRTNGIHLFQGLMLASYGAILIGFLFGLYQWPILLVFLTLPKIRQNLKEHQASLPHPRSFGYSIKNMILFNSSYALGLIFMPDLANARSLIADKDPSDKEWLHRKSSLS